MVNVSIVIPLSLLAISVSIGIFIWMWSNNLDTGDISFIDACYGRYGDNDESCAMFAVEDIDWDTKILCHEHDDDGGTYTIRGFFHAIDDAKQAYTVNGELDVEAATASYFEWFNDECGKGQPLPEGAVDVSIHLSALAISYLTLATQTNQLTTPFLICALFACTQASLTITMTKEEWDVLPDAEGEEEGVSFQTPKVRRGMSCPTRAILL